MLGLTDTSRIQDKARFHRISPATAPPIPAPGEGREFSAPGGFTLLELLVVMLLLGVVLMTALPRFTGTGAVYLRTDASRVSSLIRFINDASATRKAYYRVSFDISAGEISTERSPDGVRYSQERDPGIRRLRLREGVLMEDIVVPELGKVNTGTVRVVFTPAGAPEPFTLHLISSKKRITLTFNPYSGEVRMEDGYVGP
ncbi:MAG: prepilin-type N-terminal cleavage/methylation domain-containing protein [Thermodesulfobacteriota bacterium]